MDDFNNCRVMITGGSGFIGSHVAESLQQRGAHVVLVDTRKPNFCLSNLEFIEGDIRDPESVFRAAKGCDVVLHLAASLGVERILSHPDEVIAINLDGTKNVLRATYAAGVRKFLFTSSSEVYGEYKGAPFHETAETTPVSVYGKTKLAAEQYCQNFASKQSDMNVSIVRLFNVYGPRQREDFVIPRFMKDLTQNKPPVIYGDGKQVRAYTYISDAVDGILRTAFAQTPRGDVFNIANQHSISLNELAHAMIDIAKVSISPINRPFGHGIRPRSREIFKRIPSISKAEKEIAFCAEVNIHEGLHLYNEWYQKRLRDETHF